MERELSRKHIAQMLFIERIMKSQNCKEHKNFNHEREGVRCKKQIRIYNNGVEIESEEGICSEGFSTANKFLYFFLLLSVRRNGKTTCQFGFGTSVHVGILVDYWESINKLNLLLCLTISHVNRKMRLISRCLFTAVILRTQISKEFYWRWRKTFIIFLKWKKCKSPNVYVNMKINIYTTRMCMCACLSLQRDFY